MQHIEIFLSLTMYEQDEWCRKNPVSNVVVEVIQLFLKGTPVEKGTEKDKILYMQKYLKSVSDFELEEREISVRALINVLKYKFIYLFISLCILLYMCIYI